MKTLFKNKKYLIVLGVYSSLFSLIIILTFEKTLTKITSLLILYLSVGYIIFLLINHKNNLKLKKEIISLEETLDITYKNIKKAKEQSLKENIFTIENCYKGLFIVKGKLNTQKNKLFFDLSLIALLQFIMFIFLFLEVII